MKISFGEKRLRIRLKQLASEWKHTIDFLRAQKKISFGSDETLIRGKIVGMTDARKNLIDLMRNPCP